MTACENQQNKWPFSRVLITGGCGFLGSHLAEALLGQGHAVACVDNFSTGSRDWADQLQSRYQNARVIEFDISANWDSCPALAEFASDGLSHVFHLASPASPNKYMELSLETLAANSIGLERALNFASEFGARLVFSSSSEIYGFAAPPHAEDTLGVASCFGPRACYVEGKRFGEALVYSYNKRFSTSHGVVRIFNTYGPRMSPDDGRVILNLLHQAVEGRPLSVYGDGQQTRSFCYVDDLTDGVLRYAESDICEPLNLGNDAQISILALARMVRDLVGDEDLTIVHGPAVQDEPVHRRPDLSLSQLRLAPWRPKVNLAVGLAHTLSWLSSLKPMLEETSSLQQPLHPEHQTPPQECHPA